MERACPAGIGSAVNGSVDWTRQVPASHAVERNGSPFCPCALEGSTILFSSRFAALGAAVSPPTRPPRPLSLHLHSQHVVAALIAFWGRG